MPLLVVGDRLPGRRGRRLRGREGRPLPGHRPGDGDPDRADVRRGHGLLPAAARPLPRGARDDTPDPMGDGAAPHGAGDRLRGRDRRRRDARAHASPTTTRRAGWARCWRSAPRSPCSPASRCCPRCSPSLPQRAFTAQASRSSPIWPRIGALVRRRPAMLAAAVVAVLVAGALGNLKEQRHARLQRAVPGRRRSPSRACASLQEKFPPGQAGPVDVVLVPQAIATATASRRSAWTGARASTSPGPRSDGKLALVRITLDAGPVHRAGDGRRSRSCARTRASSSPDGAGRRPDGRGAATPRPRSAATRKLIVPLALALVFLIVAVLLRSADRADLRRSPR